MADTDAGPRVSDLLVVGELCVDIIVALDGDLRFGQHEQLITSTTLTMGSSSAITACGAAALGVVTEMVGVVGRDDFGDFIVRELDARGVGTARIRIDGSVPTGSSTHLTRPDGDRAILTAMGSIGEVRTADAAPLGAARHLHVGSYFLQRSLWQSAPALFADARAAGLTTSLDGNFDPDEQWDRGVLDVLTHTDVFFANDQELTGIAGLASPVDAVEAVLNRMPVGGVVVHKRGADGATVAHRVDGTTRRVQAEIPPVEGPLVDTVGAGDSLAAGFLAGLLTGAGLDRALALGVACGTASTRGPGGVGAQPRRATADSLADRVALRSH